MVGRKYNGLLGRKYKALIRFFLGGGGEIYSSSLSVCVLDIKPFCPPIGAQHTVQQRYGENSPSVHDNIRGQTYWVREARDNGECHNCWSVRLDASAAEHRTKQFCQDGSLASELKEGEAGLTVRYCYWMEWK